jgi:uridylate kinase
MQPIYKRILIKLSGEILGINGIQPEKVIEAAKTLIHLQTLTQIQIALVVGAGNWWRGSRGHGQQVPRVNSDQIGMLATVMNAIALTSALRELGAQVIHQSALPINTFNEPIDIQKAKDGLNRQAFIIFSGGIGEPYFSTDTASALRAAQIEAEAIFKSTQVDGLYQQDPKTNPNAKLIKKISHEEVLNQRLQVMDSSAFEICKEAKINIRIFAYEKNAFYQAATQLDFGSRIETV